MPSYAFPVTMKPGDRCPAVSSLPVLSLKEGDCSLSPPTSTQRLSRLSAALAAPLIDLGRSVENFVHLYSGAMRKLLWLGVPEDAPLHIRADIWRLVLVCIGLCLMK